MLPAGQVILYFIVITVLNLKKNRIKSETLAVAESGVELFYVTPQRNSPGISQRTLQSLQLPSERHVLLDIEKTEIIYENFPHTCNSTLK